MPSTGSAFFALVSGEMGKICPEEKFPDKVFKHDRQLSY
jgi:hypothetical protein